MRVQVTSALLSAGALLIPVPGRAAFAQGGLSDSASAPAVPALRAEVGLLGRGALVRAADGAVVASFAAWRAGSLDSAAVLLRGAPAAVELRVFRANWAPGWWAGTAGVALAVAGAYSANRVSDGVAIGVTTSSIGLALYGAFRELRGRRALERAVARHNAGPAR